MGQDETEATLQNDAAVCVTMTKKSGPFRKEVT